MSGLPRAIVGLDEYVESKNILVYGDTGTGKTELIGHLPGRVLVLASEDNVRVIRRAAKRFGESDESILARFRVWPIRSAEDLDDAYNYLRDNPDHGFDWVAIDSATSIEQRIMRAAMERAVSRSPEKRDIDLPDRPEHLKRQMAMRRIITDFNELPVNVFWIAQAMRRENADGEEIVLPFITGKDYEISAWACAQMQAFGYYTKVPAKGAERKGQTDRVLMFSSFSDSTNVAYWAKDRYDVLPKRKTMARGDEQVASFADYLALIDNDPAAQAEAKRRVDERDDRPPAEKQPQADEDPIQDKGLAADPAPDADRSAPLRAVPDEPEPEEISEEQQAIRALLTGMDADHLREAAASVSVAVKGKKRSAIVIEVAEAGWKPEEEGAEEPEEDEDESLFEESEPEPEPEPAPEPFDVEARIEDLKKIPADKVKETLGALLKDLGIMDQAKGKKKSEVLALIAETERKNHEGAAAPSTQSGFRAADED